VRNLVIPYFEAVFYVSRQMSGYIIYFNLAIMECLNRATLYRGHPRLGGGA
jgi:hypothetical protein